MSKGYESIQSMALTAAQSGIWVGQALEPTSAKYNTAEYIEFKGSFCPKSFEAASQYVLQNVAALNVSFKLEDLSLVYGILEPKDIESNRISYVDLSSSTSKKSDMLAYMRAQTYLRLAIEIGENYRHSLIKLGDEHYVWYLCIHHIASDGYSFSLIVNAVLEQYKKISSQGKKISLSFDDYTYLGIEDKRYRQSELFSRDAKYWIEFLLSTESPRSFSTCSIKSSDEKISKSTVISAHDFNRIKTISNQYKINWDTLLISIIGALFYKYSGIKETVFGLPVANRLGSKIANIPCNHMNMVPIKIQIKPLSTLLDLNATLIDQIKVGRKHWRYRYEDLQNDLKRILDRDKLFGPTINVMYFDKNIELDGCQVKPYTLNTGPVDDISFAFIKQRDESVTFILDANPRMYTKADVEKIKTDFIGYIQKIEMRITERIVNNGCTVESLLYWQETLDGYEILNLPINNLRAVQFDANKRNVTLELSDDISDRLRYLALSEGTNLFSVLLSAWYVVLSKLTGQTDILVGTTKDAQYHTKANLLIGELVNSLLLRGQLSQTQSVRELVSQVHQIVIGAKAHQDLPFECLVETAGGAQGTSIHRLFQVMFTVEHFDQQSQLYATDFLDENLPSSTNLYLNLFEGPNTIVGRLNFSVSLFNTETIERIVSMYLLVLKQFAEKPCTLIQNVFVLSDKERETLLHTWNWTDAAYPHDSTLHQLFEEQVDITPDNIALVFEGEELTYRELNERANQLAHAIRQSYQQQCGQSMPADTLVALYLERSLEMIISILAILKAGGAYVPISPEYPPERTGFILSDTKAPLLVTQRQYLAVLEELVGGEPGAPLLMAADGEQATEGLPIENPEPVSGSRDLAYVIYTSGTTGQPKGVMIEHRSINNLIKGLINHYPVLPSDVTLLIPNYIFDAFIEEVFITLLVGAQLVILPSEDILLHSKVQNVINEYSVNRLGATPSWLLAMRDHIEWPQIRIIAGGEVLPPSLCQGNWDIINTYGPTESTITSNTFKLDRWTESNRSVPIGSPLPNYKSYVLNAEARLLPVGVPGELYIGGAGLARGYLNRPELMAERFIDNPFATEGDSAKGYTRLYKTGDLVRWLPDGNLEYLGRNDFQVKIRGFRIELAEIENTLMKHADIGKAVVVTQEHNGQLCLVAYLVMNSKNINTETIDNFISNILPDYMLPKEYVQLEALPLTINGKLDRRALPTCQFNDRFAYSGPRNSTEENLCEIWSEVLKRERTGIDDDFFKVGGSSLNVFILRSKIWQRIALDIPVKAFYSQRTIRKMMDNVITERFLCLEDEVAAMKEISFSTAMIRVSDPSRRHIFLTGATGFVGKYILHELLKDKNVNLTCLIRADNKNDGFFRLKSTLENAKLWCEDYIGRIAIVNGDLGQEKMGMTPKGYSSLSATVDTIFHCAVHMNHLATYDMIKKINVDGTNHLLHFATQTRVKVFNTLSTVGVFNNRAQDTVEEDTLLDIQKHNSQNGYCSSKWVAEALVLRARAKGLITNIFRLGLISGSRKNQQNDRNQWFGQLLSTCRLTGLAFKGENIDVSTVPVDFVAKAVIYLSAHSNGHSGNYHIVANTPYTLEKIIEQYNSLCDSKILIVPFLIFIERLKVFSENNKEIPIPFFIKQYLDHKNIELDKIHLWSESAKIKCEKTTKILTKGGIVEKEISADMIVNYIENELN
ncbi:non-ribosomal peptide synthetase [Photorhabdus antumapuensis]|uniref:non-ribosomal peptide synthetase n=1 Tax=Photorhabdus antumapuensis TaxID=2862867 RepID=UPI001CED1C81|nr:non-ribosomal peptide synthetase [Photorhabdus antumapuensis]MCA6222285.1 amino acid adenylation domain-containing protein [Photorhabdus antumapuensis]